MLDSLFNIIATAIPIIILQLVTLPFVGIILGEEEYGVVVTIISLYTLLSFPFGNVLNNIRLLLDEEYKKENLSGDFNVLLSTSLIISSIMVIIGTVYYVENLSFANIFLIVLITCFNLLREYLIVSFRIHLNFKGILYNNLLLAIGYLFGTYLFYITGFWQSVFIFGYSVSLVYIIRCSTLIIEPIKFTKLFKTTTYKSIILFISSILGNLLTYADKLIIFPLLGPSAVSVYYASTLIGKIVSIVINPINGVILSYLAKLEGLAVKSFISILFATGTVGIVGYFISVFISPFILHLIYPLWAKDSLQYIYVTTATAIVGLICSVVQPFVLKFTHMNWQLLISGSNVLIYIIFSILLYKHYGLMGFCVGILISNVYQLVLMICIFVFTKLNKAINTL